MAVVTPPDRQARLNMITQMLSTDSIKRSMRLWIAQLGTVRMKQIFAVVVDKVMSDFVAWAYAGTYNEEVQDHLRYWTEHVLSVWISVFLCVTDQGGVVPAPINVPVPGKAQVERYKNMAYSRLWALRVNELFDIVVDWDDTVAGIDDIKPLLTTPQARQYVSQKFATTLQTRLLHPGASTVEILQIYISTIRAFKGLDPRGVLLSKVSGRVRQYLRERDDTIKLVVAGLLADPSTIAEKRASDQNSDVLSELAWELQHRDLNAGKNVNSMDWNNMKWQPEPIDAVPDQAKSAKHMDVIGSVISLFESKDVFVKELQVTLAERLLRNKENYDQETSVIEHLKIRFGDAALQACEVMLKDVLDSRRLDQVIRKDQGLLQDDSDTEDTQEPEIHAKILSRLFWPSLPGSTPAYGDDSEEEQRFKPPLSILHQRNLYEQGFENLKQTRKLTWNDNLGQVEIELSFADGRTYHDEVLPYQAGVIYAFNNEDEDSTLTEPITRTVSDLSTELTLPTTLVRSACLLFVSKRILQPSSNIHDAFTVLEHLPPIPGTLTTALDPSTNSTTFPTHTNADLVSSAAAAQVAADRAAELAAQQAAKEAEAKEKRAKMAVYQQFVMAMLTNQGAMPLPRIAMMLGMVVPGGFPFSNEELREFLAGMVRDGGVVMLGANYKKA
ncbi:hypothetical protein LTR64_002421 [Lithohypha guttulata]|uniref:uncharacterized protein n=1 Tax=Lithohypha guttulata TaxID=1690604 RepID=UPI002DDDC80B|nr:hypothetical protein LTR51_001354 [Lithohypha guttulata]